MGISFGVPKGAQAAIDDMLDNCAKIRPGQEVLLMAQIDGLYGGDNLVDQEAMSWIQSSIERRGANASMLWIDEKATPHAWRFPPVVKAALLACDVFINNSFDMEWEDLYEYKEFCKKHNNILVVRNFATTAPLLSTDWAQTPYELLCEIRYQASLPFKDGVNWQLTDMNGTHLEGKIIATDDPDRPGYNTYSRRRREEPGFCLPWPEWKHTPIKISDTNGIYIFESMLSWWSRYIGISPYFNKPIRLNVENNRITKIEGGSEADAFKRFLASMRERLGEGVYNINTLHSGIHPHASVRPDQCPSVLYRRLIDHSHSSNLHVHIGKPPATVDYPYVLHCTADIRKPTFRVGEHLVYDRGHLTALDHPAVLAVAKKFPGRPGPKE